MKVARLLLSTLVVAFFGLVVGQTPFRNVMPDKTRFYESVRLSALTYEIIDLESAFSWRADCNQPFTTLFAASTEGGTQVGVVTSNDTASIFVVFRGTDGELGDLVADLDIEQTPVIFPGWNDKDDGIAVARTNFSAVNATLGNCHRGLYGRLFGDGDLYQDIDRELDAAVDAYPDYDIVVTGHSLGGAEAVLYATYLSLVLYPDKNIRSYTIGCPVVGDETFKAAVESIDNLQMVRLVFNDDPIARVPSPSKEPPHDYVHAGHLLHYFFGDLKLYYQQVGSDAKGYAGVSSSGWLLSFTTSASTLMQRTFDHMPWSYTGAMAQIFRLGTWPENFEEGDQVDICCGLNWMGVGLSCGTC